MKHQIKCPLKIDTFLLKSSMFTNWQLPWQSLCGAIKHLDFRNVSTYKIVSRCILKICESYKHPEENRVDTENTVEMEMNNTGKKTRAALTEYWERVRDRGRSLKSPRMGSLLIYTAPGHFIVGVFIKVSFTHRTGTEERVPFTFYSHRGKPKLCGCFSASTPFRQQQILSSATQSRENLMTLRSAEDKDSCPVCSRNALSTAAESLLKGTCTNRSPSFLSSRCHFTPTPELSGCSCGTGRENSSD